MWPSVTTAALPRVLVTRSEPGASETVRRLRTAGFDAVAEPLFAIAPITAEIPDFDALAFTSANGVRRFAALSSRRDVTAYCVGARTAEAARAAGFADAVSADGDAGALADLIGRRLKPGVRLLHVGNEESRGDIAAKLTAAGHKAAFVAVFRAIPVEAAGPRLAAHLAGGDVFDAVMIHSPRAGAILADLARLSDGTARLPLVAISAAAAAPLAGLARAVEIAATPDEPALISALARLVFG